MLQPKDLLVDLEEGNRTDEMLMNEREPEGDGSFDQQAFRDAISQLQQMPANINIDYSNAIHHRSGLQQYQTYTTNQTNIGTGLGQLWGATPWR